MHGSDTSFVRMIEGDGASAYLLRLFDTFRTTVHCTLYNGRRTLFNIQHLDICLGYCDIGYIPCTMYHVPCISSISGYIVCRLYGILVQPL